MNAQDNDLEHRLARALIAHAVAASALGDAGGQTAEDPAGLLTSLDDMLADCLETMGVDAETMAGAIARVAIELASNSARER